MIQLNHKNLDVYNEAIKLVKLVYEFTSSFPKQESFGLTSQIRCAAVSIPSNISEGASRKSGIERKRFFEIERSSLVELDTQIDLSIELEFLKSENLNNLSDKLNHIFALLSNLIAKS